MSRFVQDSVAFRFVAGNTHPQCYNAQLAVDMDSRLIVAPGLTQEVNDKQQLIPALEKLHALPPELGTVQALVADNGFMRARWNQ